MTSSFEWLNGLPSGAVWIAAFSLLGLFVKQWVPLKQLKSDDEGKLRGDLLRRVEKLERELDRKEVRHQAERALDRHKLNNIGQCFDAVMMMLEASPEKAPEIVAKVKEMRARQLEAEALEKAAIHAAAIVDADEREHFRDLDKGAAT